MADLTRRPSQAAYNKIERSARRQLTTLAGKLAGGKIDADEWEDRFTGILEAQHAQAAKVGRQRAGDLLADLTPEDEQLGAIVATGESRYLHKFANDVRGGRYSDADGNISADAIAARSGNYANKLVATANESFVQSSDSEDTFDWHLGYTENSCGDCPDLADDSPYTASNIPTYPRSGDTECLFNCQCSLVRNDGITGFLPLA